MTEIVREIDGVGRLTFEEHRAGSLKNDGTVRARDYRVYKLDGKRLPSVTTLLSAVLPAPGLIRWAEDMGARGVAILAQEGRLPPNPEEVIGVVRQNELGADAAKEKGAARGINVHDLLRQFMETGKPPNPIEHEESHRAYVQALARWLIARNPEPVPESIEQIVANPSLGYAGRMDLRATIRGPLASQSLVIDAKTQANGNLYAKSLFQAQMYRMADEICGSPPADGTLIVVFDSHGEFHELLGVATEESVEAICHLYQCLKPINASVDGHYRAVKAAA